MKIKPIAAITMCFITAMYLMALLIYASQSKPRMPKNETESIHTNNLSEALTPNANFTQANSTTEDIEASSSPDSHNMDEIDGIMKRLNSTAYTDDDDSILPSTDFDTDSKNYSQRIDNAELQENLDSDVSSDETNSTSLPRAAATALENTSFFKKYLSNLSSFSLLKLPSVNSSTSSVMSLTTPATLRLPKTLEEAEEENSTTPSAIQAKSDDSVIPTTTPEPEEADSDDSTTSAVLDSDDSPATDIPSSAALDDTYEAVITEVPLSRPRRGLPMNFMTMKLLTGALSNVGTIFAPDLYKLIPGVSEASKEAKEITKVCSP